MTKILIVDDHEMIRDGLRRVIDEDPSLTVVGEASNSTEALEECRRLEPDLVLLDLLMPGSDSLELVDEMKSENTRIGVLMLTALPEERYALRCLRAGADGFLSKHEASGDLLDAVRAIRSSGKYLSETLATLLAVNVGRDYDGPVHECLSARESEVLSLMGSGLTVSEIARKLGLSVKTISTYRSRILEKTELRNSAEIIRYAIRHGLAA